MDERRTFNTMSREIVHEACEAMRLGKTFGPHAIVDMRGDWIAEGRIFSIGQFPGPEYCFTITIDLANHTKAAG